MFYFCFGVGCIFMNKCTTVLVLSRLKKISATAPRPHRTVFNFFAIFKNVAHSLTPGDTASISASHQASIYVQRS